jgi:hypothetical protein
MWLAALTSPGGEYNPEQPKRTLTLWFLSLAIRIIAFSKFRIVNHIKTVT